MNEVTVACLCPGGTRHPAGERVAFRERLDFRTAAIARKSIAWLNTEDPDASVPEYLAMLSEFYLLHCIERWTICDAKGKPVEVNKANVKTYVLSNQEAAFTLSEVADELYGEVLLAPLAQKASSSSPPTLTNGSISATSEPGTTPKRSRRSSTESIQTVAIGPI